MKKSKKIILTISAVTLTAGVLLTGIGYMKGGRFGFVFSDGKFISADSIEEEKQPFILEKKKLDSVKDIDINILSYADIRILPSADNSFYLEDNLPGEYVLSSSFGIQAAVSLHLVNQIRPDIPVILTDTGYLFPETYRFIDELTDKLKLNLKIS